MSSQYKPGDKFEIEIDSVFESNDKSNHTLFRIKGFKSLVFDEQGLNKLNQIKNKQEQMTRSDFKVGEVVKVNMDNGEQIKGIITKLYDDHALVIQRTGEVIVAFYEDMKFTGTYTGIDNWLEAHIFEMPEMPF